MITKQGTTSKQRSSRVALGMCFYNQWASRGSFHEKFSFGRWEAGFLLFEDRLSTCPPGGGSGLLRIACGHVRGRCRQRLPVRARGPGGPLRWVLIRPEGEASGSGLRCPDGSAGRPLGSVMATEVEQTACGAGQLEWAPAHCGGRLCPEQPQCRAQWGWELKRRRLTLG